VNIFHNSSKNDHGQWTMDNGPFCSALLLVNSP
jgi:hypothetical protein